VFVAKNSDATLFSELVRSWHQFGGVDRVHSLRKISKQLPLANLYLVAPVRPVWHRLSCSNETVRNALKHEFLVKWSGSGAFIGKNSDATLFT
jgi:hypothetical protein